MYTNTVLFSVLEFKSNFWLWLGSTKGRIFCNF